jgi:hypothetical protein
MDALTLRRRRGQLAEPRGLPSEIHTRSEQHRVVIHGRQRLQGKLGWQNSELIPHTKIELRTLANWKRPENDSWRQKQLVLTAPFPVKPICVVELELRPKIFCEMILQGEVARERSADLVLELNRHWHCDACLYIEITPAFARRQCRRDHVGRLVKASSPIGAWPDTNAVTM